MKFFAKVALVCALSFVGLQASAFEATEGKTPFDVIDETLYGVEKFRTIQEKVDWVCNKFEITQKQLEE